MFSNQDPVTIHVLFLDVDSDLPPTYSIVSWIVTLTFMNSIAVQIRMSQCAILGAARASPSNVHIAAPLRLIARLSSVTQWCNCLFLKEAAEEEEDS